jgi:ABC-type uncharacterized transport system auxiliary subunit
MRSTILAAMAILLTGCAGGLERNAPEPAVYRLTAPAVQGGSPIAADLLVLRPVVAPGLATDRIATAWPGNRIDYYAGARWSDELGAVAQGTLVDAIRAAGRVRFVEGDPSHFRATHVLGVEIARLEADYSAGDMPVARVTIAATVARYGDRRALMATTASAETAARANTLTAVIAALDEAFGKAAAEIVTRADDALAADLAGQP